MNVESSGEKPAASYPTRKAKLKQKLIHIGRCLDCGRPAIRHRGREICLHCDGEPLFENLRGGR